MIEGREAEILDGVLLTSTEQREARVAREREYSQLRIHVTSIEPQSVQSKAFSDWVAEQSAVAAYLQQEAHLQERIGEPPENPGRAHVVFSRLNNRYNPMYSPERKALKSAQERLTEVRGTIQTNPSYDYHHEIDFLQGRYGWSLYEVEKNELESQANTSETPTFLSQLQLQANAHQNVGRRLQDLQGHNVYKK
jgi:hypothetical protein